MATRSLHGSSFLCFWLISYPLMLATDQGQSEARSTEQTITDSPSNYLSSSTSTLYPDWPLIPAWPVGHLEHQDRGVDSDLPPPGPLPPLPPSLPEQTVPRLDPSKPGTDPIFDHTMMTNVTAQLGETATLRCRVRNLGERPVSWVRRRDWHILTSGLLTYTNDDRFQVVHHEGAPDWLLQIRFVQKRDNGTYECQVSTGRGTLSHYFNLHIIVPEALILGKAEYHIEQGSNINLVCIIENSPTPPQYVFWYHNERMINYDTARGGINVQTEPGPKTHSRLSINDVRYSDSGNYSCRASNTEQATIHVFVSEGDKTAAIQRQAAAMTSASFNLSILLLSHYITSLWILR